jgi:ribosomal protein L37AE/L43A
VEKKGQDGLRPGLLKIRKDKEMRIRTECPTCGDDDLTDGPANAAGNARKQCYACGYLFVEKATYQPTKAEKKKMAEMRRQQEALSRIPGPGSWERENLMCFFC